MVHALVQEKHIFDLTPLQAEASTPRGSPLPSSPVATPDDAHLSNHASFWDQGWLTGQAYGAFAPCPSFSSLGSHPRTSSPAPPSAVPVTQQGLRQLDLGDRIIL